MDKKVVVIAGGTGEIGSSILHFMKEKGYHIISISRNPTKDFADNRIEYLYGDMSKSKEVETIVRFISEKYKHIDALINTIGGNIKHMLEEVTEEDWNNVMDMNLKSVFFLCRAFAPLLMNNKKPGKIINFASTAGINPLPRYPYYIAAKAGVIALTKYFAKIYAPQICVNCIAPGFILTKNHSSESYNAYEKVLESLPMKEMTSIDEILDLVWFIFTSKTMTGQTLIIDGGLTL